MSRISDASGGCDAVRMAAVERLVTIADVDDAVADEGHVAVQARQHAVLADGRRLPLLQDRGWGSTQRWATVTIDDVAATTRMVVGPDEPVAGATREEAQADHWAALAGMLQRHGVTVDARDLPHVPHDVELDERLLARLVEARTGGEPLPD